MPLARGDQLNIPKASRDRIRAGAITSASAIAQLVADEFDADKLPPNSPIIDVGCGEGYLVEEFNALGHHALGVDGDDIDGPDQIIDFEGPLPHLGEFALVCCLEVAEHVSEDRAREFVRWLCSMGPIVLFSAAIPGQGGDGHVNERPAEYWASMFAEEGYAGSGQLRWPIWHNDSVEWWYKQNLMVFWKAGAPPPAQMLFEDGCPSVVHPEMWQWFHGEDRWVS